MNFLNNLESYNSACERNGSCRGRNILMQYDDSLVTAYAVSYFPRTVTSVILSETARDSENLQRHASLKTPLHTKGKKKGTPKDIRCVQHCLCNPDTFTTRQINARAYILDDTEQTDDVTKTHMPRYNNATENDFLRKPVQEDDIHFELRRPEAYLWMQFSYLAKMHCCDWGKSYSPDARIMAMQITMDGFEEILRLYANDRLYHITKGDVAIEWARDQSPMGTELHRSFVRIGIRGEVLTLFEKYWLFNITDITAFVKRQGDCVQRVHMSCTWTPTERVYIPDSSVVCRYLGLRQKEPAPIEQNNEQKIKESASATLTEANSKLRDLRFGQKQEVILYLSGAFNPIHSGHVKAIVACKSWLENTKKYKVCETRIGIMSDSDLKSKLFNRPNEFCINFDHRRNLCEIACSDHPWIRVHPLPCKGQVHFGGELRKTLNKPKATLGIIIGSDHVVHSPDSNEYLREQNTIMLCVGRKGMKGAEKAAYDRMMKNNPLQPHEIYIVPTKLNDLSSTAIRQKLMKVKDDYTKDGEKLSNLTMIVEELIELNWIKEGEGRYICNNFEDLLDEQQIFATCSEVQTRKQQMEKHI